MENHDETIEIVVLDRVVAALDPGGRKMTTTPLSLKTRLLAFVTILLISAIASLSAVAYWKMRGEITASVEKEIEAAVLGNREALSRWIAQRHDAIDGAAGRMASAGDPLPFLNVAHNAGRF